MHCCALCAVLLLLLVCSAKQKGIVGISGGSCSRKQPPGSIINGRAARVSVRELCRRTVCASHGMLSKNVEGRRIGGKLCARVDFPRIFVKGNHVGKGMLVIRALCFLAGWQDIMCSIQASQKSF